MNFPSRHRRAVIAAAVLAACCAASQIQAAVLIGHQFNFELEGDDPTENTPFTLAGNPGQPVVVRFDGFFENLETSETGVNYELWWTAAAGSGLGGMLGIDFTPLPGSGQLPVQFEQTIPFTPATMTFYVEGGGPSDHFRFTGDFTVEQIPEPAPGLMIGAVAASAFLRRRVRA